MPGRDGTGPMGAATKTGRGLGGCACAGIDGLHPVAGVDCQRRAGRGMHGHGAGRGITDLFSSATTRKEALEQNRDVLQRRIDEIDKQLKDI